VFSIPVIFTAVISAIGFLLNTTMLVLVLSKGRRSYHYLFATILLICAIWDIGILLTMLRNNHPEELYIYGYVVFIPCTFLTALIYQFTNTYLQRQSILRFVLWGISILGFIGMVTGLGGKIDGVYFYSWGNMYRPDRILQITALVSIPLGVYATVSSSWKLFLASKVEESSLTRRHMIYMAVSFLMITLAYIKLGVLFGIDSGFILPAGMFVNDIFSALIAVAIIKHNLFDITFIIKKGAVYSLMAGVLIFVFSFSEHVLITYVGDLIGDHSQLIHFISIGIGILILMPIKHRLEKFVEGYFREKRVQF
jgi:hypothetical protein